MLYRVGRISRCAIASRHFRVVPCWGGRDSRALFEKRIRLGVEVTNNDSCFRIAMCYFDQFRQPFRLQPLAGVRKGNPVKVGVRNPDVSGMARLGFARLNQPKGCTLSQMLRSNSTVPSGCRQRQRLLHRVFSIDGECRRSAVSAPRLDPGPQRLAKRWTRREDHSATAERIGTLNLRRSLRFHAKVFDSLLLVIPVDYLGRNSSWMLPTTICRPRGRP